MFPIPTPVKSGAASSAAQQAALDAPMDPEWHKFFWGEEQASDTAVKKTNQIMRMNLTMESQRERAP